ncbi:MAG TPA: class I SAM-dependent methyltransferase [Rhizomicrobium sp.]|jgi:ubiquinone/menaquinone biosynthesis C-methylase UbiE|nr:class I SAM-dependent methyltransferase [Rhizomicrobium sp.]
MNTAFASKDASMRAGSTTDQRRVHVHALWSSVAPAWAKHADYVDRRAARITKVLLDLSAPKPGERVLELACGPGGLGMAAAALVGPAGQVVMSDVSTEMTEFAGKRAAAAGLANTSVRVRDIEDINEPDGSFDVVLCREGLMFALDPAQAAREIHRVLRPNGRLALAVWGPRARNPWLGIVLDCVSAQVGKPMPPPGMPGPFALDDSKLLGEVLKHTGLADVAVAELESPLCTDSFEEWWERTSALAGPLANLLPTLPPAAMKALQVQLREATGPYATYTGMYFPGVTLIGSARRAA